MEKISENDFRQFSRRFLTEIVRDQVDVTTEYAAKMSRLMGRKLSYDELGEIARRSLSLIYTGLTPEERAKKALITVLRSWGINQGALDKVQVNGRTVRLTMREYDLLEMFAASPDNLVTHGSAERRFGWDHQRSAFSENVRKINSKLKTLGSDSPIELVSIPKVGYKVYLKSGKPNLRTSSALDPEEYLQPQTPDP